MNLDRPRRYEATRPRRGKSEVRSHGVFKQGCGTWAVTAACFLSIATLCRAQSETRSVDAVITADRKSVFVHEDFTLTLSITSRGVQLGQNLELVTMPSEKVLKHGTFQRLPLQRKQNGNAVVETRRFRCEARIMAAGALTLSPTLRVGILQQRRGFFGKSTVEVLRTVRVQPLTLGVSDLPKAGRPADFSGAVGRFSFNVALDPPELAVGQLVTATMTVSGIGYLEDLAVPRIPATPDIKAYEPRQVPPADPAIRATFRQVLVPQNTNAVAVPPVTFTFFDPRDRRYKTLTEGPFELKYHAQKTAVFERFRPEDLDPKNVRETPLTPARRTSLNREALSTLALAAYWILAAAAIIWLIGRWQPRPATRTLRARRVAFAGIALLAATVLFIPYRLGIRHGLRIGHTASLSGNAIVRFAPSHGSLESFRLTGGTTVRVFEHHGTWVKVASGNRRGWVPSDSFTQPATDGTSP